MSFDKIYNGLGASASVVCPVCGTMSRYFSCSGDIRCTNCERIAIEQGLTYTGTCPNCHKKFSDCECGYLVGGWIGDALYPSHDYSEEQKVEIRDLLYTIGAHCKIGKLLMEQGQYQLLPTILEDITSFSQELPDYCIKEG